MDTEKQKKKVLHFRKGDEHRVVIEKENYTDSIFSEQYKQSLLIWNRICNDYKATGDVKNAEENVYNVDGVSNIIAFCGDRGEGKTSCQMSFAEILRNKEEFDGLAKQLKKSSSESTYVKPFVMPLVDPLYFDQNHHLLDHVIGQLYSEVEETERNKKFLSTLKDNFAERKELLMQFQSVRRCLKQIEDTCADSYDELEELSNRAASVRLHTEITLLFKYFLKYVECDKLVIPIDDIDLNMSFGYQMVEDIRKYLCNPYCVLLLAVKVDQLTTVIQTRMMMDMQKISEAEKRSLPMAQKYVTKLLPYSNRVIMPTITDWAEREIECRFNETETDTTMSVKDYVVNLIYDRTRYLFFNEKGSISPIVPRSLRGLRQLLGMLEDMVPYTKKNAPLQNKFIFKDYFYNAWISCMSEHDQLFAQKLVSQLDTVSINKLVIDYLRTQKNLDAAGGILADILREDNMAHNISIGDVFYVLNIFSHSASDDTNKSLAFFLYSFYSIHLYDIYDEISVNAATLHPNFETTDAKKDNDEINQSLADANMYRADAWYKQTNKLQRFVNGSMFTYDLGDLLPKEKGEVARDRRVLFTEDMNEDIALVNKSILDQSFTIDAQKAFKRCELYAMFTKRQVEGNNKFDLKLSRRELDPYYLIQYTSYTNFLEFDILAPFANAINFRYSYWRFENIIKGFYSTAVSQDWSLLAQMIKIANDCKIKEDSIDATGKKDLLELYLASNSIIRVSDVLVSLIERLKNKREVNNKSNFDDILQTVVDTITKSGIKLYDKRTIGDKAYEICFDFLQPLFDFMIHDVEFIKRLNKAYDKYQEEVVKDKDKKKRKQSRKEAKAMNEREKKVMKKFQKEFSLTEESPLPKKYEQWVQFMHDQNSKIYERLGMSFWEICYKKIHRCRTYKTIIERIVKVDIFAVEQALSI